MANNFHERFLQYIQYIKTDRFPAFVGIHFNSDEYADLMDIACSRLSYFYNIGNEQMVKRYVQFIDKLRCRKIKRYYNDELYKLLKDE